MLRKRGMESERDGNPEEAQHNAKTAWGRKKRQTEHREFQGPSVRRQEEMWRGAGANAVALGQQGWVDMIHFALLDIWSERAVALHTYILSGSQDRTGLIGRLVLLSRGAWGKKGRWVQHDATKYYILHTGSFIEVIIILTWWMEPIVKAFHLTQWDLDENSSSTHRKDDRTRVFNNSFGNVIDDGIQLIDLSTSSQQHESNWVVHLCWHMVSQGRPNLKTSLPARCRCESSLEPMHVTMHNHPIPYQVGSVFFRSLFGLYLPSAEGGGNERRGGTGDTLAGKLNAKKRYVNKSQAGVVKPADMCSPSSPHPSILLYFIHKSAPMKSWTWKLKTLNDLLTET